jgi:hypothetical protein
MCVARGVNRFHSHWPRHSRTHASRLIRVRWALISQRVGP